MVGERGVERGKGRREREGERERERVREREREIDLNTIMNCKNSTDIPKIAMQRGYYNII